MISDILLAEINQARELLERAGFTPYMVDDVIGLSSSEVTMTNDIPNILVYQYVHEKHHIDLCIHQNLKNIPVYAAFVHYWGPGDDQCDWGEGLRRIIDLLSVWAD